MGTQSALLENMFKVDLLSLVWIAVAVVVVGGLAVNFYHALNEHEPHPPKPPPMSRQTRWLGLVVATWWLADLLWHIRARVVTPPFWHHELWGSNLPWLWFAHQWWQANPVLWDFTILVGDGVMAAGLYFTVKRHPPWLFWLAMAWGLARWLLQGASVDFHVTVNPIGPNVYLLSASAAYLALDPRAYRFLLSGLAFWLALDSLISQASPVHWVLAIGLGGLGYATLKGWSLANSGILAGALTIDILLRGIGTHFLSAGLSALWAPALFLLVIGYHLPGSPTRHRLGG